LRKGAIVDPEAFDVTGAGYLLDSAELFQMEHQMGLNIKSYRKAFEERASIVEELRVILDETKKIERQRLSAARAGNQAEMDRLLPTLSERESIVHLLNKQLIAVNNQLHSYGQEFKANYSRVLAYREELEPHIEQLQYRLTDLAKGMARHDKTLKELSAQIFSAKGEVDRIVTSISIDDLSNLSAILEKEQQQLSHMRHLRDVHLREQYYQAKALWLMGRCLYSQSTLETFPELVDAEKIGPYTLEDEHRHGITLVEDFNREYIYSDKMFGGTSPERDKNQANFEQWISHLESSALNLFEEDLPKYVRSTNSTDFHSTVFTREQQLDNMVFIARSRFLCGEIYMRQAMRAIRSNYAKTGYSPDAISKLNAAKRSFQSFLEFVQKEEQLSEKKPGAPEFPTAKRHPVKLIEDAYIYLGIIASLGEKNTDAISIYRDMLAHLAEKVNSANGGLFDSRTMGAALDPEKLEEGYYETQLSPFFIALMTHEPLTHEVLYRIGKNYKVLAEQALQLATELENEGRWLPPAAVQKGSRAKAAAAREQFVHYTNYSVAYFSQLLQAHNFSSYRTAAIRCRAELYALRGDYKGARNDYIAILGDPDDEGGSWDPIAISPKGDLPGEFNPGFPYVALELGKLYLNNGDYDAAAEIFQKVQDGVEGQKDFLIRSKIAYAEALVAKDDWVLAHMFLSQLVEERAQQQIQFQHLYHYDLILDLAEAQRRLGSLSKSIKTAGKLLSYVPAELVQGDELNLSSQHGMHRLNTSARDMIRPLARYAEHVAEVSERLRNFSDARHHYELAERLYRMVPWQEDRLMREKTHEEFEAFRDVRILACQWGKLRGDVLQLQASLSVDLQRSFNVLSTQGLSSPKAIQAALESVRRSLEGPKNHEADLRKLLEKVNEFAAAYTQALPETKWRTEVALRRKRDREAGGQGLLRFEALKRIYVELDESLAPSVLLPKLASRFSENSVEEKMINDFLLGFVRRNSLSEQDRAAMLPTSTHVANLLRIEGLDERFTSIQSDLERWLEEQVIRTGLDDSFVRLSPQGRILEDVTLFKASLLAMMPDYESYHLLVSLTNEVITAVQETPPQWQDRDKVWQIAEIAALSMEERSDWERMIEINRFLLTFNPVFLAPARQQRYLKTVSLATALLQIGKKLSEEQLFTTDEEEKELLQAQAEGYTSEGIALLRSISSLEGNSTEEMASRIRARQILEEAGV
jgi:hypothetical protein